MSSWLGSALLILFGLVLVRGDAAAQSSVFEGQWIGGFRGGKDRVFVRVALGGPEATLAGRIDVPASDDRGLLLERVRARGDSLRFEVPGEQGNLLFEGSLKADGRVVGSVRQGTGGTNFELMRVVPISSALLAEYEGTYQIDANETVLVYAGHLGPTYVNYRTGRMGVLYPISETTFVAGPTLLSGWPVESTLVFERDGTGRVRSLAWQGRGDSPRRGTKRSFFTSERVKFVNGGVTLGATLLTPDGRGPFPAVVMIHGSGPVTREQLVPFGVAFALNGVAVLMPDKRGVGESTGTWTRATFDDLAADALAGVAFLKERRSIDSRRIGLQGASLGGWVAPLAAVRSADVRFLIVEAAPAITPAEHERLRVERQMLADHMPSAAIAQAVAFMDRKFEVARTGAGWDHLVKLMELGRRDGWASYVNPPTSLESLRWHWQNVLSYDPVPVLERLRIPVLALYGERDTIVPIAINRSKFELALARAGNCHVTIKVLPNANHGFLAASTGGPSETPTLRGFVPDYFEVRADWLREQVEAVVVAARVDRRLVLDAPEERAVRTMH